MGKKALISWGGWDGHEPEQTAKIANDILKAEGFDVELVDNLDIYEDEKKMKSYDLIVPVWTMSTITSEQSKGLLTAVKNGTGIAGWHGGMGDSFRDNTEYQWMVGGQWVAHPGNIIKYTVEIIDNTDPITAGIKNYHLWYKQKLGE